MAKNLKSQIRKMSYLRKVRKSNQLQYSANLRICNLRNLFADRPPLQKIKHYQHISAKIPTQENFKLI